MEKIWDTPTHTPTKAAGDITQELPPRVLSQDACPLVDVGLGGQLLATMLVPQAVRGAGYSREM